MHDQGEGEAGIREVGADERASRARATRQQDIARGRTWPGGPGRARGPRLTWVTRVALHTVRPLSACRPSWTLHSRRTRRPLEPERDRIDLGLAWLAGISDPQKPDPPR